MTELIEYAVTGLALFLTGLGTALAAKVAKKRNGNGFGPRLTQHINEDRKQFDHIKIRLQLGEAEFRSLRTAQDAQRSSLGVLAALLVEKNEDRQDKLRLADSDFFADCVEPKLSSFHEHDEDRKRGRRR